MAELGSALDDAIAGHGRLVMLAGEPGIGKTRIAQELAAQAASVTGAARDSLGHGLIYGSPETVCEKLEGLHKMGAGGIIIHFRLGSMSWDVTEHSLRLFAERVAPQFLTSAAA